MIVHPDTVHAAPDRTETLIQLTWDVPHEPVERYHVNYRLMGSSDTVTWDSVEFTPQTVDQGDGPTQYLLTGMTAGETYWAESGLRMPPGLGHGPKHSL